MSKLEWKIVLFTLHEAVFFLSFILSCSNCYCLTSSSNVEDIRANTKVNFALNSSFKHFILKEKTKKKTTTLLNEQKKKRRISKTRARHVEQ